MLLMSCAQHCSLVPKKHFHPQDGNSGPLCRLSARSVWWTVPVKGLLRGAL